MIYFTSDLHFCHNKDFLYKPRGFETIDEMNEAIVRNWNNTIDPEDKVYILGDIMLNDNQKGIELFNQLNGYKFIIVGNHDTSRRIQEFLHCNKIVNISYADMIKNKKHQYYLSHYPTITSNYSDTNKWINTIWCLCGHTHSQEKFQEEYPHTYNVALDAHDCKPVSIEEIEQDIRNWYNERK